MVTKVSFFSSFSYHVKFSGVVMKLSMGQDAAPTGCYPPGLTLETRNKIVRHASETCLNFCSGEKRETLI